MIGRARIIKGTEARACSTLAESTSPLFGAQSIPLRARVLPREVVELELSAARRLRAAETEAQQLLERAMREAAELRLRASAEARAEAIAGLVAHYARIAALDRNSAQRRLDTVIGLAKLLAERLLGEQLASDPSAITKLAKQALKEVKACSRLVICAHPSDRAALELALAAEGGEVLGFSSDAELAPGNLRIETEWGTLDAALGSQLEKLALVLRESLRADGAFTRPIASQIDIDETSPSIE